jgi:hypothetical protein
VAHRLARRPPRATLLCDGAISLLAFHFTESELSQLLATALARHFRGLARFARFYAAAFPRAPLAETLALVPAFDVFRPCPHRPLFDSLALLERMNLTGDSLGLTKVFSPALRTAAALQQMGLFAAAVPAYLTAMECFPEDYCAGLLRVRACAVNATFPRASNLRDRIIGVFPGSSSPRITLPCSDDPGCVFDFGPSRASDRSGHPFTTFRSSAFLPFVLSAAVGDEVHQLVKLLMPQQQSLPLCELARATSSQWLPSLDQHLLQASSLAWRLSIWAYISDSGADAHDALSRNRRLCDRLVDRSRSPGGRAGVAVACPARRPRLARVTAGGAAPFAARLSIGCR